MSEAQKIMELEEIINNFTTFFIIFDIIFFFMMIFGLLLSIRFLKSRKNLKDSNEYLSYTIKGQEEERARIARDLHDTIAQDLRYCKSLAEKKDSEENIPQITSLIEKSISQIRLICYNLAPSDIVKNNLGDSLINLCNCLNTEEDMQIRLSILDNTNFAFLTEIEILNIYRTVQESLINAVKHSKASEIVILVRNENGAEPKGLYIFVSDDGCGFNSEQFFYDTTKHFGLLGIKNRCQLIGAKFSIQSNEGEGTQICIYKPQSL